MNKFVLGFLYFPEDKSGYIPAAFEFLVLIILCALVFMWVRRISKKQEAKAKVLEDRILSQRQQSTQKIEK
ncbi:hypothetical protein QUF56_16755 [Ureibacillus composti]|nr:hypothetical protein [Ureibacillus composti]